MELTFDWVSIKREEIQNNPWKRPINENFGALIYLWSGPIKSWNIGYNAFLLREGFKKKDHKLGLLAQPKVGRCPEGV